MGRPFLRLRSLLPCPARLDSELCQPFVLRAEGRFHGQAHADGEIVPLGERGSALLSQDLLLACQARPLDQKGAHFVRRLFEERELAMEVRAQLGVDLAGFREAFPEPDGFILGLSWQDPSPFGKSGVARSVRPR
jgi:hypothetical protein